MTNHTKGPWAWGVIDKSCAQIMSESPDVEYADMNPVLSVSICDACSSSANEDEFLWGMCLTPNKANAERIVSCVNALEGIENPEAIKEVIKVYPDLIRLVDSVIKEFGGQPEVNAPSAMKVLTQAKAALAKLKATG